MLEIREHGAREMRIVLTASLGISSGGRRRPEGVAKIDVSKVVGIDVRYEMIRHGAMQRGLHSIP